MSQPDSTRHRATSTWPARHALVIALALLPSRVSREAFAAARSWTTSICPRQLALLRLVLPLGVTALISALLSSRARTTSMWPYLLCIYYVFTMYLLCFYHGLPQCGRTSSPRAVRSSLRRLSRPGRLPRAGGAEPCRCGPSSKPTTRGPCHSTWPRSRQRWRLTEGAPPLCVPLGRLEPVASHPDSVKTSQNTRCCEALGHKP